MDAVVAQIIREYGLFGLLVLFLMAAYWLQYKSGERKDAAIERIGKDFSTSLKENTSALHRSSEANLKLADATRHLLGGFDRLAAQNREEHGDILTHIRARAR